MKFKIFSVYDLKGEAFGMPLFFAAKGQAVRAFDDQCNDPSSTIAKHPGDYTLMEIGEYDDSNGLLVPLTEPASLGTGVDFKKVNPLLDTQLNQQRN